MANVKLTTIFSRIPLTVLKNSEKRKPSYWLKKLNVQREQSGVDDTGAPNGQFVSIKDQNLAISGKNEQTKNTGAKKEADRQILNDLVKKSNRPIISISSLFPWTLFPNTIEVEEGRVTFKFRQFLSSQSHSVDIKDISNVFIESSLFFATLQVVSRTYIQNDIRIGNLNKTKAKKVLRIIEGLRTFAENNINTSNYDVDELISKIEELHTHENAEQQTD